MMCGVSDMKRHDMVFRAGRDKRMKTPARVTLIFLLLLQSLVAQHAIRITFRHYPTSENVSRAFVPGSFNGWGPNSGGAIAPDAPSRMKKSGVFDFYHKTCTLETGRTEQYKFHEHYADGSPAAWITDPLNPNINTQDNDNSVLTVPNAMIFEVHPPENAVLTDSLPYLTAGIFVSEADSLLWDASYVRIDTAEAVPFTGWMIDSLSILHYPMPGLSNASHTALIHVETRNGLVIEDSTRFTTRTGEILFVTPSHGDILASEKTIRWQVAPNADAIRNTSLYQSGRDPVSLPVETGIVSHSVLLDVGMNTFVVELIDTSGAQFRTDTLRLEVPEPRDPQPSIVFSMEGEKIRAAGRAGDPQGDPVEYLWDNQPLNPAIIPLTDSVADSTFLIDPPAVPGDYAVQLTVTDGEGRTGQTVQFFSVSDDLDVILPGSATTPRWVEEARIYCLFVRSYTEEGTLRAAAENLQHIRDMGFSVIWVLPVMDVEGVVDQGVNIGYNIVDFYNVEPFYGANRDFKDFVDAAHALGLRVILDVTPNHSSRSHPIAMDVRSNRLYSRYYDFYQHEIIPHDDMGLGQSVSPDGIVYYSAFSDALLNWNYADAEARQYMIDVYRHWLTEYDVDGFRFDVYWGPHRRYGRDAFDRPLREALRAVKSGILLLGEAPGTGVGSEFIYADRTGGVDMGYDWNLNGAVQGFPSISSLHSRLVNAQYRPGPNALFLRFLENQDEDRAAYRYGSIEKTVPVSTALFTATGIPMIFQGQEAGMGYGMGGGRDQRVRSTVDWDNPPVAVLAPHYQKLAHIRRQFPAFRRQYDDSNADGTIDADDRNVQARLSTSDPSVYAMARPGLNENGLAVMNFSGAAKSVNVYVNPESWMEFSPLMRPVDVVFLNDLYWNTSVEILGGDLDTLHVDLGPYGVSVFTVSLTPDTLILPELAVTVRPDEDEHIPDAFVLYPNAPNPFNAGTRIRFDLPAAGVLRIRIVDVLGRQVRTLFSGRLCAAMHDVVWDGKNDRGASCPSGVYIAVLQFETRIFTEKLCLIR